MAEKRITDAKTFFVYGLIRLLSIIIGIAFFIKGIFNNGNYGLVWIILIVLGFYL